MMGATGRWVLAVAALLFLQVAGAGRADAALMLKLESGSSWVSLSDSDSDGLVTFSGPVGGWTLHLTAALSQPMLGPAEIYLSSMDLVKNSPADPLFISASDQYTDPVPGFHTAIGGVTSGKAEMWAYLGASAFAQDTEIAHLGPFDPGYTVSFSGAADWIGSVPPSYYLTAKVKLSDVSSRSVSSFDASVAPVPEPGTMVLLGSGLVLAAGWGRKRFRR